MARPNATELLALELDTRTHAIWARLDLHDGFLREADAGRLIRYAYMQGYLDSLNEVKDNDGTRVMSQLGARWAEIREETKQV